MAQTHEKAASENTPAAPTLIEPQGKKKKKYSDNAHRSLQELELGLTKSARKVAKAVQEGLETYEAARDESRAAKRDGALRDLFRNQSKALRKALPIAAEAPSDLMDKIADMKVFRKMFKG